MDNRRKSAKKSTKILFSEEIDTPYAYCIVPKMHYEFLTHRLEREANAKLAAKIEKNSAEASSEPAVRSLLSVSTWDGRQLFDLRSLRD